ncbi:peptidase S33 [Arthrobacter sp. Soil736]|uniref:FtsQ-type POTRA domain-containing protein n=1 Tax=Arthrobacter sp. Soil736 TaxID=1736395 RepID=UPI0006F27516|nr:FtsQ-type POTRA domain-containing protein [Arthrobacter sp. Soil736]KRE60343.1 peptidase S33 [Arthrobacter sp. Soil736]
MASSRRPTYKPVRPGSRDKAPESREATQPGVISASKSAPVQPSAQPAGQAPGKQAVGEASGKQAAGQASGKQAAGQASGGKAEPGNVLAFPEPKGKRLRRNIIVASCIVAALVAGLLLAAVYSPVLAVRTVTVSGTKLLKPVQIQAALKPLLGTPLPQVSDEDVNALLKPLVQIKSVTTQAHPPSVLVVQVHERVPVALVKRGKEYLLVDVDGVRLGATADPESVKLPVIDGGAGTIGKDLFQATTAVLGALPATVLARLSNASAKSVDAVELKLVDGQTIIWGNAGERELKARVLEALLKVPADPANPVNIYDVSVPRHPVTR